MATAVRPDGALARSAPPDSIRKSERSLAPDIARGGMLLLIAIANAPIHLWGGATDDYGHRTGGSGDQIALFVEQLLVSERSRPMFAILYGFGIAVMVSRMFARGTDPKSVRKVLRRRSWWLILFGIIHATFLFLGDILTAYGATGLIALGFAHLSNRVLKRWLIGTSLFVVLVSVPVLAVVTSATGDGPPIGDMPAPYLNQLVTGLVSALVNTFSVMLMMLYVPLVLFGLLLQRSGWIDHPEDHLPALKRVFATGMAVNVLSSLPIALTALDAWQPGTSGHRVALGMAFVGGMYAGLGYICGFALLAHRLRARGRRGLPGALAAVGERSLTCYLLQSLIMAPLLAEWGFGLGEGLGYLAAHGVAAAAWLATVAVAVALDRAGRRGPFEAALRRLTYGSGRTAPRPV